MLSFLNDYGVTHVETTIDLKHYNFNGHELIGIYTNNQDSVLAMRTMYATYRDVVINCQLKDNYYGGLQIYSTNEKQTQYNLIFGLFIKEAIYGTVWGAKDGEPSVRNTQSETYIYGYKTRSVMIPFLGNQENGYLTFSGATFDCIGYEWIGKTSSRYVDNNSICVKNIMGDVVISDSEIVCPTNIEHTGVYGEQIFINNTIFECAGTQAYLTGNARINGVINGFIGSRTKNLFIIHGGSKGQFTLNNCYYHYPEITSSDPVAPLFFADNTPQFEVVIDNVTIDNCPIPEGVFGNAKLNIRNLKYPTAGEVINAGSEFNVLSVDQQGNDMPTIATTGKVANWIVGSGTTLKRLNVESLYGINVNGLEFVGAAGWADCKTSKFSVISNRKYVVNIAGRTVGGTAVLSVDWFDKNKVLITSDQLLVFNADFINYSRFIQAPANATYGALKVSSTGDSIVTFTDIYMCRENPKEEFKMYSSTVPTTGDFEIGDIVYNSNPTNYIGWVCTAKPNTFKSFGAITA